MRYNSFLIENYKGISDPLEVKLDNNLIPIIGVNECGKTTILQSIFAFDYRNDELYNSKHIKNIHNLNNPYSQLEAKVTAIISFSKEGKDSLACLLKDFRKDNNIKKSFNKMSPILNEEYIEIIREINGKLKYSFNNKIIKEILDSNQQNNLAIKIVDKLPSIIYFDDFNDSIPDKIELKIGKDEKNHDTWAKIIEEIFYRNNKEETISNFLQKDENLQESILSDINNLLEARLKNYWNYLSLLEEKEKTDKEIKLKIFFDRKNTNQEKATFEFKVIDINNKNTRVFPIKDRSKGFFWFINFIMKVEFNPFYIHNKFSNAVFLLDEPGSYLHAKVQSQLARKLLEISKSNIVIYTTHSHYLLDPEYINTAYIMVVDKDIIKEGGFEQSKIKLTSILDYPDNKFVLEVVYKVLGLHYDLFSKNLDDTCILVEGITDFYLLSLIKENGILFVPFTGANQIVYYFNLFIALNIKFLCLYDNDKTGERNLSKIQERYICNIDSYLTTYKDISNSKFNVLEDIFSKDELDKVSKILKISQNLTYKKKIKKILCELFYKKKNKEDLLEVIPQTLFNIQLILNNLKERLTKTK